MSHALASEGGVTELRLISSVEVVSSEDESEACHERAVVEIARLQIGEGSPSGGTRKAGSASPESNPSDKGGFARQFQLEPGQCARVTLRLEHQHFLHGPHDLLLGRRTLTLRVGPATFQDVLLLDQQLAEVYPPSTWDSTPAERRDPRVFITAPDSIRLAAYIPGQHGFDFPERPVRHDTSMKLSFWYLIAPGLDGKCTAEIKQYRDAPRSYLALSDARVVVSLPEVGRWVRVVRVIRSDPRATTLRLRFTVDSDVNAGEMWIDDVKLEPLSACEETP